jgi:hypothetical protein
VFLLACAAADLRFFWE